MGASEAEKSRMGAPMAVGGCRVIRNTYVGPLYEPLSRLVYGLKSSQTGTTWGGSWSEASASTATVGGRLALYGWKRGATNTIASDLAPVRDVSIALVRNTSHRMPWRACKEFGGDASAACFLRRTREASMVDFSPKTVERSRGTSSTWPFSGSMVSNGADETVCLAEPISSGKRTLKLPSLQVGPEAAKNSWN